MGNKTPVSAFTDVEKAREAGIKSGEARRKRAEDRSRERVVEKAAEKAEKAVEKAEKAADKAQRVFERLNGALKHEDERLANFELPLTEGGEINSSKVLNMCLSGGAGAVVQEKMLIELAKQEINRLLKRNTLLEKHIIDKLPPEEQKAILQKISSSNNETTK